MRTRTVVITLIVLFCIILIAIPFFNRQKEIKIADLPPGTYAATIKEVIQTTKYTYFKVDENDKELWLAVTKREASEGDVIYYSNPLEMNNFVSKELGRTFPTIFFVADVSDKPITDQKAAPQQMASGKKDVPKKEDIKVKPIKGGITISELYEHNTDYAGKTVKIRGEVTRYNSMVMGKNWVHIQDGTDFSGNFDLTVTTMDSLAVGNTVTFTGTVSLDKDFGAGYFYKIIMEEARASDITSTRE
ncbi:MAG: hypothetical protein ACOYMF_08290 [Bacteroidales bacterium]